ncbi:MAG: hypothetical protein AAFR31_07730 [Cyanobacteria bacterium J06627_8]
MQSTVIFRFQKRVTRYVGFSFKNPTWLLMFVFGRILLIRKLVAFLLRDPQVVQTYHGQSSHFNSVNTGEIVHAMRKDGFYQGLRLSPYTLKRILNFVHNTKMYVGGKPEIQFLYADKSTIQRSCGAFAHGIYPKFALESCAVIQSLVRDPKLLEISAQYLDAAPKHISTNLCWCFQGDRHLYEHSGSGDAQIRFHYDLDDYHSIKFFFYLTDVNPDSGPHYCVLGSHRKRKWNYQLSPLIGRSDEAIIRDFGQHTIRQVCGDAGFGFVEDTFCFHRGTPPTQGDRLLLTIEYGLQNFGQWK